MNSCNDVNRVGLPSDCDKSNFVFLGHVENVTAEGLIQQ
jgi:hypothetical protein